MGHRSSVLVTATTTITTYISTTTSSLLSYTACIILYAYTCAARLLLKAARVLYDII